MAGAEPAGRRSGQAGRLPYVRGSGRTASPGMAIDRFTVCVIISSIISTISLIEKRCEPPTSCAGGRVGLKPACAEGACGFGAVAWRSE